MKNILFHIKETLHIYIVLLLIMCASSFVLIIVFEILDNASPSIEFTMLYGKVTNLMTHLYTHIIIAIAAIGLRLTEKPYDYK